MLLMPKIKELSFLVYGLGLTGRSVAKFLIKNLATERPGNPSP